MDTQKQEEIAQQVTEEQKAPPEVNMEKSLEELRRISEFRHKSLSDLTVAHFYNCCSVLMSSNGVSEKEKIIMRNDLGQAIRAILDFGLGITKVDVKEHGKHAKDVGTFAAVFLQAIDNRFILLADNLQQQERKTVEESKNETVTGSSEETSTKEQTNG